MDIAHAKIDHVRIEQGGWVENIPDMGDLRLKVRGAGNADWRRLQAKLTAAVPRGKRVAGRIDPDENDRIISLCLRDTGLLDWENVSDNGVPVPYSKEAADRLLTSPEFRAFRDAALWACSVVGDAAAAALEGDAKN